jgi:hypothetical protein
LPSVFRSERVKDSAETDLRSEGSEPYFPST